MTDLRWYAGTSDHPKVRRLVARCGEASFRCLARLWEYAASHRQTGDLSGMSVDEIEAAAGWEGEPGAFLAALRDFRFVDRSVKRYALHGWEERQGWIVGSPRRSEAARRAALARWGVRAESMPDACGPHAEGNAPSPYPSPSPNPYPNPKKEGSPEAAPPLVAPLAPEPDPKRTEPRTGAEIEDLAEKAADALADPDRATVRQAVRELLIDGVPEPFLRGRVAAIAEPLGAWAWKRTVEAAWRAERGPRDSTRHGQAIPDSGGAEARRLAEERRRAEEDRAAFLASGYASRAEYLRDRAAGRLRAPPAPPESVNA